jgi:hypothetical protein
MDALADEQAARLPGQQAGYAGKQDAAISTEAALPWNKAWGGRHAVTTDEILLSNGLSSALPPSANAAEVRSRSSARRFAKPFKTRPD